MGPRGGLPSLWSPPRRVCVQPRRHPGQRRMTKWHQLGDPCCHPAPWYHHAPPRVCIHSSLVKPMMVLLPTLWAHAPFSNKEKLSQFTQLVLDGAGIKVRPAHPCTLPILILQLCKWVPCWVSSSEESTLRWVSLFLWVADGPPVGMVLIGWVGGRGDFAPQGISGNVWRHSGLPQPGSGEGLWYWLLAGTVRGAGKPPTVHKTAPKIRLIQPQMAIMRG